MECIWADAASTGFQNIQCLRGLVATTAILNPGMRYDGQQNFVASNAESTHIYIPMATDIRKWRSALIFLCIVWKTAQDMWHRMMDAVEPEIHEEFQHIASHVPGVLDVHNTAIRWLGHRLYGEMHITVNCQQTTLQSHFIAEEVRHQFFYQLPVLMEVTVHTDPPECDETID